MWPFARKTEPVFLTNTLTGAKEEFKPLTTGEARMYSCGPTVYGRIQIGNLRSFILSDTLARMLAVARYKVKRVMNITDVGHMVADADEGEDKMAVGAKRDNTTPEAIAKKYSELFLSDIKALNVETQLMRFPRATDYIPEQIRMIEALKKKGYTYALPDGVYFDTSKFPDYGKLGRRDEVEIEAGARVSMVAGKKHPQDFVLWRAAKPNDLQKWDSPWGEGNPGWSIECSAMAKALLGEQIDIHTGGEDNAPIHHNNEIAQSECSSGKHPFVRYWLHGAFLTAGGEKLSKSLGNSFTLEDVINRGFSPIALRYLFLQAHYRSPLSFTWETLGAAQEALVRLYKTARDIRAAAHGKAAGSRIADDMRAVVFDDLATPQGIALLHVALGNTGLSDSQKWGVIETAEALFGLSLTSPPEELKPLTLAELPPEIAAIAKEREEARKTKDFAKSDELRIHLSERGYAVEDGPSGSIYTKKPR